MVVSMDGKRVKLKRPYTTDETVRMFKDNCFYLYGAKVVDEGTLVDLFGPIVIEILDDMINALWHSKTSMTDEAPHCSYYNSDFADGNGFRGVNLGAFGEVVSVINERIVCSNYAYTGGKIVEQINAERKAEAERKKEEARAKRAAARAAKKAAEG